mmetsp:Transcript_7600/g.11283  ORF Transcript_7600/g.11283 Transcript_7600/m.11283 type:complete len:204 (-) Transcript_7600:20-631(-)
MTSKEQTYRYFLVLDFEATCIEGKRIKPQEIIEFPTVIYDRTTQSIISEFHAYVKPTANPILTEFCISLTGIQQEWVDKSKSLREVLSEFHNFLKENNMLVKGALREDACLVTCGDFDTRLLHTQMRKQKLGKTPPYFKNHVNIKKIYHFATGRKAYGMANMLKECSLELKGRHHSGIDDSRNISQIVDYLLTKYPKYIWQPT